MKRDEKSSDFFSAERPINMFYAGANKFCLKYSAKQEAFLYEENRLRRVDSLILEKVTPLLVFDDYRR